MSLNSSSFVIGAARFDKKYWREKNYLYQELHHLSVNQTMNGLSIHVSDKVPGSESCFLCRSTFFYVLKVQTRGNESMKINYNSIQIKLRPSAKF